MKQDKETLLNLVLALSLGIYMAWGVVATANEVYVSEGKEITKLEAMRQLIVSENKANVQRCYKVEMSEKGGIRKAKDQKLAQD